MVPDNSAGIPRVPAYSGIRLSASNPGYGAFTLCGPPFQTVPPRLPQTSRRTLLPRHARRHAAGLGYSPFARRYWGNRFYFLLLRVLRCFSSPRSPPGNHRGDGIAPAGLPHSDIRASTGICPSARLFAACHVLLRLREPRHPPCALRQFRLFLYSRPSPVISPFGPWRTGTDFADSKLVHRSSGTRPVSSFVFVFACAMISASLPGAVSWRSLVSTRFVCLCLSLSPVHSLHR